MVEYLILGNERRFRTLVLRPVLIGALLTLSSPAHATYSLLAVDTETGGLAGFAVSCIGTALSLSEVIRLNESNISAAQGYFFEEGRDELALQLSMGTSPGAAIEAALSPSIDPPGTLSGPTYRQYAALSLDGTVAQHSGANLSEFAGHITGTTGAVTYAIQGNFLTESGVLDRLGEGFTASDTSIAERALSALIALADSGGGDSRCSPRSGDAGYFVLSLPGSPRLEVETVEPEQEIARALAAQIREVLPESSDDASPPDGSTGGPASENGERCSWTRAPGGRGAAPFCWLAFGVALLARRCLLARRRLRG